MGSTKTRAISHFFYIPDQGAAERAGKALARAVGGQYNGYAVRAK